MFVGNKAFTNLPRKFNVGISGCTEHCTHAESQDLALTPAMKTAERTDAATASTSRSAARWDRAAAGSRRRSTSSSSRRRRRRSAGRSCSCSATTDRARRANRARLSFLVETWGVERFRQRARTARWARPLERAGRDARIDARHRSHRHPPAEAGRASTTPACWSRWAACRRRSFARSRASPSAYGNGDIRFTTTPEHHHSERAGRGAAALQARAAAARTCRTIRLARCAGWSRAPASTIATSR